MPVLAPLVQQLYAAQKQAEEAAGPLPVDITAYLSGAIGCSPGTDPLGLIVAQLDPLIAALAPALDVLRTVNPLLPAIPVPPAVNVPPLPAGADPVLAAAEPATSEVCGQLAIVLLVSVVGSSLPLPFTGQHYSAITGPLFAVCAAVRPQP
jgi:hypothetical protein